MPYVFKVTLVREGTDDVASSFHVVARTGLEASFVADDIIRELYSSPVNSVIVSEVTKVAGINNLIIADMSDNADEKNPFDVDGVAKEKLMTFEHEDCGTEITVVEEGWDTIECPECKKKIDKKSLKGKKKYGFNLSEKKG